jgi:hypothetical protein
LASFFEKKEADLSGRKNVAANRGRKGPSAGGERKPRKVNGNHSPDAKEEAPKVEPSPAEEPVAATEEKEEGAEEGS